MMAEPVGAGRVLAGRYTLRTPLGRGGMGTVWLATDSVLGRQVAIKEVTFDAAAVEERRLLRERTLREARAAARFTHPRVTTVHDVVEEDGRPWIVMEHIPSRTLAQVLQDQGPMPPDLVSRIGLDLLGALQAAHRAGIVHRDVKPDNVLIGAEWRAWLTDFGIATSSGESGLTEAGILLGSPSYMSPERARNELPSPAADVWSLGATLFTAVEGRPPFDRGEAMSTLLAVITEPPAPILAAGPLTPVLLGCLTKDPAQRMTVDQVQAGLNQVLVGPVPAMNRPPAPPPPSYVPRQPTKVERLDVADLSALAKATRSLASKAAHKAAETASAATHGRTSPSAGGPANPSREKAPIRAPAQPARPASQRPRWRFKRRWVVVPVVVVLLLCLAVVLLVIYVLGSLEGFMGG
ncbi:MAG: serine/threonine protein kinase [Geodermatophilaceae bacterium]|nr:serine/threonine protein kinase [Geodermatophilaceae bacterium]